jgi:predicted O-linked N-acetylglucosamine transferase (SPINDLY family)
LAYRPADVTQALSRYGDLVCDAAGAYFAPRTGTKPDMAKDRTRLGIVCGHVHAGHPVWEILLKGIVAHLTREKFEVFLYHTGSTVDEETAWATARVDRLTQGPKPTADWVDLIRQHRPDILFYPEIGMDPVTCALAAIRLAPLQAASWGHPVTTGLKSIDLFLSGELLESVGADAHYREKLVRLPLTGVCTQAPHVSAQTWEDGASTRRVRFALPHQPIKFDPGDDTLLAAIAKAVGACEFWIALPAKLGWATERLRSRLARVFSEQGLDPESYLRVTPWLSREQFAGFLDAMDVYLDCPAFSGYTTAWQALNRGIPIVTLEGDFLRQRLAAGLLRQIGCIEGIASSRDEYLRIAAEFANESRNFEARASHRRTIREGASKADDNRAAVSALERVLLEAAATHHR